MSRLLLLLCVLATHAGAWERHDLLTRESLRDVDWLDSVPALPVTTPSERPEGLSHAFLFQSAGETAGETVSAREVLERYSDEPDRGPDGGLVLSWQERYVAPYFGSTSHRLLHSQYPIWSVHHPLKVVSMGYAAERAELLYRAAVRAFDRDDPYWGFRYLAWVFHYAQDASQPFHASQLSTFFLRRGDTPEQTALIAANYHFAYQAWVARRMVDSAYELFTPLRGTKIEAFAQPGAAVDRLAERSVADAIPLFEVCYRFFDPRFREPRPAQPSFTDQAQLEPPELAQKLADLSRVSLELAGRATRGMLELIRPIVRERWLEGRVRIQEHGPPAGTLPRGRHSWHDSVVR